jgi:hypothetical protein
MYLHLVQDSLDAIVISRSRPTSNASTNNGFSRHEDFSSKPSLSSSNVKNMSVPAMQPTRSYQDSQYAPNMQAVNLHGNNRSSTFVAQPPGGRSSISFF